MKGRQLFSSLPDTICTGAREFEGDGDLRYFQGTFTTRGCEEDDQEVVRGEVHKWQKQVVLHSSEGTSYILDHVPSFVTLMTSLSRSVLSGSVTLLYATEQGSKTICTHDACPPCLQSSFFCVSKSSSAFAELRKR